MLGTGSTPSVDYFEVTLSEARAFNVWNSDLHGQHNSYLSADDIVEIANITNVENFERARYGRGSDRIAIYLPSEYDELFMTQGLQRRTERVPPDLNEPMPQQVQMYFYQLFDLAWREIETVDSLVARYQPIPADEAPSLELLRDHLPARLDAGSSIGRELAWWLVATGCIEDVNIPSGVFRAWEPWMERAHTESWPTELILKKRLEHRKRDCDGSQKRDSDDRSKVGRSQYLGDGGEGRFVLWRKEGYGACEWQEVSMGAADGAIELMEEMCESLRQRILRIIIAAIYQRYVDPRSEELRRPVMPTAWVSEAAVEILGKEWFNMPL